jgi:Na+/proline symporter
MKKNVLEVINILTIFIFGFLAITSIGIFIKHGITWMLFRTLLVMIILSVFVFAPKIKEIKEKKENSETP